jgi:two-component system, OmpR family, response regulator MprA
MTDHAPQVLVVDDDRAIRETLRVALEDEGYRVAEAGDGAQALALLRAAPDPYVVLLDLRMPMFDGAGLLRVVAADDGLAARHAYAIITANLDAVPAARAATRGRMTVPVIPKPFDLDEVLDFVARAAAGMTVGRDGEEHTARDASW